MEYRIQLYTEEVQDWVIPNLDALRWGAEEASFSLSNPSAIQPNAPKITFSTHHAAMEQELALTAVFVFGIIKASTEGFIHPNSVWTTIRVSPDGSSPIVRIRTISWTAVVLQSRRQQMAFEILTGRSHSTTWIPIMS